MQKSRYNFIRQFDTQSVIYNAMTEHIAILDPVLAHMYQEKSVDEIHNIHPDFYAYLCDQGFLISDNFNELESLIRQWESDDHDSNKFSLSINPTLNCNMDCWYCYEKHDGDLNMRDNVLANIKKLIYKKLSDEQLKSFHLGFFGGEPLLNFNRVGHELIDYTVNLATENEKLLSFSFVTNGYLLTEDILAYLHRLGYQTTFQITLDGSEDVHDYIRHTKKGGKTYKRILANASHILEYANMNLVLRCNFTVESLSTFMDVATDLSEWVNDPRFDISRLSIDLHQVWQDHAEYYPIDIELLEQEVRNAFSTFNLPLSIYRKAKRYRCYAERSNNALVNYNGDIFRCTARDFTHSNRDGVLTDDGTLAWNEKSDKRDAIKWSNPTCLACEIYPLCCGACSQNKMESNRMSGCDYGYNQQDKENIITERINWLLSKAQV